MKYLFIMLLFACSCVIIPPKIELTGEKTMIERQITGEYRELEDDAWVVSSARTNVQKEKSGTAVSFSDEEILSAQNIRSMNEERIRRYKDESAIGEGRDGNLKYRSISVYEKDSRKKTELLSIIETENNARKKIILYYAAKTKRSENEERISFAAEQREKARRGDVLETADGKWVTKK